MEEKSEIKKSVLKDSTYNERLAFETFLCVLYVIVIEYARGLLLKYNP